MQLANVLRLARQQAAITSTPLAARSLATAATHVGSVAHAGSNARKAAVPLANIEAAWSKLTTEEKVTVHDQLEVLQKKDWKELSIDEKKAAYYVAFGPHGARAPSSQPGDNVKIFLAIIGLIGVTGILSVGIRSLAAPPPKSLTKEWEEAANERALEMKLNPITGISSEGYKGKGFVTHK